MSPTDRPRLAPADPLKREVQAVLREDDGSLSNPRYAGGPGRFDGYGYVAAEAYFHLAGGRDAGLRSMQLLHRGTSRWWLEDAKGRVIDLALGPRRQARLPLRARQVPPVPRHQGRDLAGGEGDRRRRHRRRKPADSASAPELVRLSRLVRPAWRKL